ncbi:hypothetical protein CAPTEDRAFT_225161 [Capitella teleta]|uniref:LNR domain-containing protein n=1 Tax=Capitella teleta TaxID=283909 RepID=R7TBF5_CAPTE|nr:hypothetical protein CAPTEDRAFT_225161 [Capitella teleta]|eukprot:ELT88812.1 hypothetical protein CAPTEDRAFT_225161 [Capitella teleta]
MEKVAVICLVLLVFQAEAGSLRKDNENLVKSLRNLQHLDQALALAMDQASALAMDQASALAMDQASALAMDQASALAMDQASALAMDQVLALAMDQASVQAMDQTSTPAGVQALVLAMDQVLALAMDQDQALALAMDQASAPAGVQVLPLGLVLPSVAMMEATVGQDTGSVTAFRTVKMDLMKLAVSSNAFSCDGGSHVIPSQWECDGVDDCDDGTDEHDDCSSVSSAYSVSGGSSHQWWSGSSYCCDGGSYCMPAYWECDGIEDCNDGTDEHDDCDVSNFGYSWVKKQAKQDAQHYQKVQHYSKKAVARRDMAKKKLRHKKMLHN